LGGASGADRAVEPATADAIGSHTTRRAPDRRTIIETLIVSDWRRRDKNHRWRRCAIHEGWYRWVQSKEYGMPFGMGFGELVLILVIVVVVFGATKLPQLGDGLGKAIKNFKRAVNSQNEIDVSPTAKKKDPAELDDDHASSK
jgi:sec-independent protein translocase protein TatA